jgi:hypothetical protein
MVDADGGVDTFVLDDLHLYYDTTTVLAQLAPT